MRQKDGTKIGHTPMQRVESTLGQPWWVVHRAHLHYGLVEVAKTEGADVLIDSKVAHLDHQTQDRVTVRTTKGLSHTFDLVIGSDGLNSIVRTVIHPKARPRPPTGNAAYRAVVPYDRIRKDPVARVLIEKPTMEVWMAEGSYIITYPISAGKDLNMVLSHQRPEMVTTVEEVDMEELRATYEDYDPIIKRIVDMIPYAQRWPLLVTGPLNTWSTPSGRVVLIGDAAHSMTNHMAQGAATSMEDGAFLAKCVGKVIQGNMSIKDAVELYERERMPKAHVKQQVSFLNGAIWQLPEGSMQTSRDKAMAPELEGKPMLRSPNLYGDPATVLELYGYDAEAHADQAIEAFLLEHDALYDPKPSVPKPLEEKYLNWFLPGH